MKKVTVKYSFYLIILMVIVLTGCGLKGNPVSVSAQPDRKPAVNNLQASSLANSVVLKWNFKDKDGLISYIEVERSEQGTPGNECKDCPLSFVGIGQLTLRGSKSAGQLQGALSFQDNKVEKGKIYKYRLMLCEDNRNCTESSTIEINLK